MPAAPKWKGLDVVLAEIAKKNPGARLEHTMESEEERWSEEPTKKILPVERWRAIVQKDIENVPNDLARQLIMGPYYFWGYDEFGRVVVSAEHQNRIVPMFVELWAGEPEA